MPGSGFDPGMDVCESLTPEQVDAFRWNGREDGLFHVKSTNPVLVYEMRPSTRLNDYISTNSDGFRDREFQRQKTEGVSRICVVGDSIAFGWWERMEETFPSRLEQLLNDGGFPERFEVYNMAVGGYNAEQEAELIASTVVAFHPDLILLQFCDNDNLIGCDSGLWWHFTMTGNSVRDFLLRGRLQFGEFFRELAGHGLIDRSYRRIRDVCAPLGVPILFVPFPNRVRDSENKEVAGLAARLGFHLCDLRDVLSQSEREVFFLDDWHPNKTGHDIAARKIADYLAEHWGRIRAGEKAGPGPLPEPIPAPQ